MTPLPEAETSGVVSVASANKGSNSICYPTRVAVVGVGSQEAALRTHMPLRASVRLFHGGQRIPETNDFLWCASSSSKVEPGVGRLHTLSIRPDGSDGEVKPLSPQEQERLVKAQECLRETDMTMVKALERSIIRLARSSLCSRRPQTAI